MGAQQFSSRSEESNRHTIRRTDTRTLPEAAEAASGTKYLIPVISVYVPAVFINETPDPALVVEQGLEHIPRFSNLTMQTKDDKGTQRIAAIKLAAVLFGIGLLVVAAVLVTGTVFASLGF